MDKIKQQFLDLVKGSKSTTHFIELLELCYLCIIAFSTFKKLHKEFMTKSKCEYPSVLI